MGESWQSPGRRLAVLRAGATVRAGPWGGHLTHGVSLRCACRETRAFRFGIKGSEDARNRLLPSHTRVLHGHLPSLCSPLGVTQPDFPQGISLPGLGLCVSGLGLTGCLPSLSGSAIGPGWANQSTAFLWPGRIGSGMGTRSKPCHEMQFQGFVFGCWNVGRRRCLSTALG